MNKLTVFAVLIIVILTCLLSSCRKKVIQNRGSRPVIEIDTSSENSTISDYLELFLLARDSNVIYIQNEIFAIYKKKDFQPIWFKGYRLTNKGKMMMKTLERSYLHGLHPSFYPTLQVQKLIEKMNQLKGKNQKLQKQAMAELLITYSAISFFSHLEHGIVRSNQIWNSSEETFLKEKTIIALQQVINGENPETVISTHQPKNYYYQQLSHALQKFILPDQLPTQEDIKTMENKTKLLILKALRLSGFIRGESDHLLKSFNLILASYQQMHGIREKSIFGTETQSKLINDITNKFKTIAVNMERLRQNPPIAKSFLWINIPNYQMTIFENNRLKHTFNVMVGSPKTPTPILSGKLRHVVTYPKWNIPPSIINKEIIPAIKKDSLYLAKKGYYITNWSGKILDQTTTDLDSYSEDYFPFNITQDPGPSNALGTMKFLFDNDQDIYLHDTNSRHLFSRQIRAFSHGCIRVENPQNLAHVILDEGSFQQFKKQLEKKQSGHIAVKKDYFVYIRYITCGSNEEGDIFFYKDVYHLDEKSWQEMLSNLFTSSSLVSE